MIILDTSVWIEYLKRNNDYHKVVGIIDCAIIYVTIETGSKLWTLDKKVQVNIEDKFMYK